MKKAVLILGYNNTRLNDVIKIKKKVLDYLSADTILCKETLSEADLQLCDGVIQTSLEGTAESARRVLEHCKKLEYEIIGVLPFSDKGTQLGSYLAQQLGLPGSDPNKILAALDKFTFRQFEAQAQTFPAYYRRVRAAKINYLHELKNVYQTWGNDKIFVKPRDEGNSRGCRIINSLPACTQAWVELAPYHRSGIMVEECIEDAREYSVDSVAGHTWLTEKLTTNSQYRAEIQQIVPAPIERDQYHRMITAGLFMAEIAGANGCAFHNEIFYQPDTQSVMAVEPNLRPAGMRIWDLVAAACTDFDPYREWIVWATRRIADIPALLSFNGYAGIRMIQPNMTAKICYIPTIDWRALSEPGVEVIEGNWTAKTGEWVNEEVKDNAGFLGYVMAKSKNYADLNAFLERITRQLADQVVFV